MTRWAGVFWLVAVMAGSAFAAPPDTVVLEELTWTELREAIGAGKTTIKQATNRR